MKNELSVIQGLVDQADIQSKALRAVLIQIQQDKQQMHEMKREVIGIKDEVKKLAREVESDIYLKPAQANNLYDAVGMKARELTKEFYPELIGDDEYPKKVGVAKNKIWALFRRTYGVSKYIYLPRKYYKSAMNFIDSIQELNGFGEDT